MAAATGLSLATGLSAATVYFSVLGIAPYSYIFYTYEQLYLKSNIFRRTQAVSQILAKGKPCR
jgi:hypothetical protein